MVSSYKPAWQSIPSLKNNNRTAKIVDIDKIETTVKEREDFYIFILIRSSKTARCFENTSGCFTAFLPKDARWQDRKEKVFNEFRGCWSWMLDWHWKWPVTTNEEMTWAEVIWGKNKKRGGIREPKMIGQKVPETGFKKNIVDELHEGHLNDLGEGTQGLIQRWSGVIWVW